MKTERDDLIDTYHDMSTDELLDHWESGTLTNLAAQIAGEELTRRGVVLPPVENIDEDADSEAEEKQEFETVARSFTPTEMHILRGRLEADGIPTFIADDNINQTNLAIAAGGVRLQVAHQHVEEAKRIVAEVQAGQRDLSNSSLEETLVSGATESEPGQNISPQTSVIPFTNGEFLMAAVIFCFAGFEFAKMIWFAHTFSTGIGWDTVAIFALILPILYFVGALLLVIRSKWSILCFAVHLPLSIAPVFLLALDEQFEISQITGWVSTAAVIYFCVYLRRRGRLT